MQKAILLGLLLLSCSTAQAGKGDITAEEVGSWCQPYKTATVREGRIIVNATSDSQVCYGAFISIQQLGALWENSASSILNACLPPESRMTELIKVFLRYLDQHPEQGHKRFADVALASLRGAFPCPAQQ